MRWLRRGDSGRSLPLFALAHVAILAGLFRGWYAIKESGTTIFYDYAGKILSGQLPYRDFVAEYPPLALGLFTVPRLLGESFRWYYVWFQTEVVLFDLAILSALYLAARAWRLSPWRVLAIYTIALLAVGPITLQQFDIFPALFTLLALLAFARQREGVAGAMLGLGIATKVYPVLLAPAFAIVAWHEGRVRPLLRAGIACCAVCLLAILPWLIHAPRSLRVLIAYHAQRGIQVESMWSTISFIGRALGLTWVDIQVSFGSWNVSGPLPDVLVRISTIALIIALALVYAWLWRRTDRNRTPSLALLARASLLVLLVALATSKVFSPQYLVWLTPMLPLVERERQPSSIALFAIVGVLTVFVFPFHYAALLARNPLPVVAVGLRNALIVALAILLVRGVRPTPIVQAAA